MVQNREVNNKVAREQVIGVLREILSDADSGLSLRPGAVKRLRKSILSKRTGKFKNLASILYS